MSTRGMYVFKDDNNVIKIFKQWDNEPKDAQRYIRKSFPFAWELPRFEADDFSCAFIAANKGGPGNVFMATSDELGQEYEYAINCINGCINVEVTHHFNHESNVIFNDTLTEMLNFIKCYHPSGQYVYQPKEK